MKSIKYIFAIFLLLATDGCEDFLERTHPGDLTYDKFYQNEEHFEASITACYYSLKKQVEELIAFTDLITDNVWCDYYVSSDYINFKSASIPTNSSIIQSFWGACYKSISYSNILITRIENSSVKGAIREVFIKEAKFIRAYSYFNLVRIYGGVPKYEQEPSNLNDTYSIGRSSTDDIYDFIIRDLKEVLDIDIKRSTEQKKFVKGRVTSLAAKTLLGKVYLQSGDYQNALATLEDIVKNSGLELENNLEDLYDPDGFSNEIIFAVNYERVAGENSPFTAKTLPRFSRDILPNVKTQDNGIGDWILEPHTVSKFSDNDKRKELIDSIEVVFGSIDKVTLYYSKKYLDINTTEDFQSGSDFIVLRYADVLLMYADALNKTNGSNAYLYLNKVRERAGLEPLSSNLSKEQLNKALAEERQKEFILEGDRWFDLSYRGFDFLKKTLNDFYPYGARYPEASIKDHQVLFPIPSDEVNLKPDYLPQNPGY